MWVGVRQRFRRFHEDLNLSKDQIDDGLGKQHGVRKSLHRAYYDESTESPRGFIVGSWGKGTAIAPPTDVDIFFELPVEVYHRIETYQGNKQSALLQEVSGHLLTTYPQTSMRGDGQVVIVGFNTITVEVVPAFRYDDYGRFYIRHGRHQTLKGVRKLFCGAWQKTGVWMMSLRTGGNLNDSRRTSAVTPTPRTEPPTKRCRPCAPWSVVIHRLAPEHVGLVFDLL